jgi:hypothetical protein
MPERRLRDPVYEVRMRHDARWATADTFDRNASSGRVPTRRAGGDR